MRHLRRWYVYIPISVLLCSLILWRTKPWEALDRLDEMEPIIPVVVLTLNLVLVALWADRSASLLQGVGRPLARRTLVPIVTFANTVNNLTPASSGEALRAVVLRERHGIPMRRSTPVIIMERLYAFYLMAITAAGFALVEVVQKPQFVTAAFLILVVLTFAPNLAYEFLHVRPLGAAGRLLARIRPGPRTARIESVFVEVDGHLDVLMTHPAQAFGFVLRTLLIFSVYALQLSLILNGLGEPVMPWTAWAAYGLAMVAGIVSSLPFGLGATDTVLAILLVGWGVPPDVAGLSAVLLRLLQTLPMGLAGVASYAYLSRTMPLREPAAPSDAIGL